MPVNPPLSLRGAAARSQSAPTAASTDELGQLREAARLMPYRASNHHALGIALAQRALFAPALDAFEAALRCDPTRVESILGGGDVLLCQGELSAASDFMARQLIAALQALRADIPQLLELHRLIPLLLADCLSDPKIDQVMQQLAHHLHEEAHQALRTARADISIALLESVKKFNPAHLGTSHTLADAYLGNDQPHLALQAFEASAHRETTDEAKIANARLGGGKLLAAGYSDHAIVAFRNAWTFSVRANLASADQAELLLGLGTAEYITGDYHEAFRSFDLSIEAQPSGGAYLSRGLAHLALRNESAAWGDFESAFLMHIQTGEYAAIHGFSRTLMNANPHDQRPLHWCAESALLLGLLDESRELFTRLANTLRDNRIAVIGLQRIRMTEGNFEAAQTALDNMAKEHPDYLPAHLWAAQCCMMQAMRRPDNQLASDLLDHALHHARNALRVNGSDLKAKTLAADALLFKGQFDRALQGYGEIEKKLAEPTKSSAFGRRIGTHKTLLADWLDQPHQTLHSLLNTLSPQTLPGWNVLLQHAVISLALDRQNAAQPPRSETPPA